MKHNFLLKLSILILFITALLLGVVGHYFGYVFKGNKSSLTLKQLPASDKSLTDFYNQSEQLNKQQAASTTATFLATGDIMFSRNVADTIQKSGNADLPFSNMSTILKSTDFNFGNLESPFYPSVGCAGGQSAKGIIGGHSLIFGAPCFTNTSLQDYNFKVLNLANNHSFDQGLTGLNFTRSLLDADGITHEGTGENLDQAWTPATINANGIKICFVGASFSSLNDGGKVTNDYVARIEDTARLKSAIDKSKTECDFVVATMHAGVEYTRTPNQAQKDFAHIAIDDGADMVIGAHPHWVQTIEKYNGKYIFYSLGNFIFDQMFSQDTREGLALKIQISNAKLQNSTAPGAATLSDLQGSRVPATLDSIELIPVIIDNYSTPRPATPDETKKILNKIGETETILK